MDSKRERSLCQAIETGLIAQYRMQPDMTDGLCIVALDNAIVALKQKFGFARNETVLSRPAIDGIVAHVVELGVKHIGNQDGLTMKDYIAVINTIRKSVIRHSACGPHAYFNFVKDYV
ncbi:hypothetical protein F2P44_20175 [Massilia sp. CCM 8695]|uniref:Uncharacterized protein n=1 Tax=Massilia frigida TaxID=2609281 RepID=A0ABX0NHC8_9BURK|nr:hypothetical protein [Massilia frigida]NHZ81575.1 hypothetical protein [Massilia frigida]